MVNYENTWGRNILYTDVAEVTKDNVIPIVQTAYAEHLKNMSNCQYLLQYEAGEQPLQREKNVRKDIDVQCVDNIAHQITEFKTSYIWGNPITLVQRGQVDTGESRDETKGISLLNEAYASIGINRKTQDLGRYVEITGLGYTYVGMNNDEDDISPFCVEVLDPRYTFVIRSSRYIDRRKMAAVTYTANADGELFFTVFTKDLRFEMKGISGDKKDVPWTLEKVGNAPSPGGIRNPLGAIPIVEWERTSDRMGCFERSLSECDNLNLMISDFSNDVENNCQAVWLSVNIDFQKDKDGNIVKPQSNDWVLAYTTADGKTPSVHPLTVVYDYAGMLQNINERRSSILEKCNVPERNDNKGGSTGVAMSDASGWTSAEISAAKQQAYIESAKMEEVRLVLKVCRLSSKVPVTSPLKTLKAYDIQPNVKRQKTYELTVKSNAIATLISHGFDGEQVIKNIPLFDDPQQVWLDSKEGIEKYQKSIYDKGTSGESYNGEGIYQNRPVAGGAQGGSGEKAPNADRRSADESDQTENSPTIDKR